MDDGSWVGYGVKLSTNSYSKKKVLLLIEALNENFGFDSTINIGNESKSQYTIYIPSKDITSLRELVKPYILTSFLKKLDL